MRVAIVGYGAMGREVERVLQGRGHQVAAKIDPGAPGADARCLTEETARGVDAAIEFSHAEAVLENARLYATFGVNAIVGTTGWYGKLDEMKAIVKDSRIGLLYGSNFSIGAHIFFALVAAATELSNPFAEYDVLGWEVHHKRKKDSPSGTALSIAKIITANHARKKKVVTEKLDRPPNPDELHFASVRGGDVPGIHTVLLDSAFDTIELTHSARNRGGMAMGAVRAAEWIQGKKGLFEATDFIQDVLGRKKP
ncbi:MAG TPA: 4-hydroxy-tetrahydrodipicolinate reductase [Spirochaetia bacterium]|nr:4-hydroxy-tetrahydrodipicolinate reductase [Spirochaetia bacterium]